MRCEACGGDGLIEFGAYRGREDDKDTRECRLCGGMITGDVPLEMLSNSAKSASATFSDVAHSSTAIAGQLLISAGGVSGVKVHNNVSSRAATPKERYRDKVRPKRANTNRLKRIREQSKKETTASHVHNWSSAKVKNGFFPDVLSDRHIILDCDCGDAQLVFNTGGQLVSGKVQPAQPLLDQLSKRARVEWLRYKAQCRETERKSTKEHPQ